MKFSLIDHFNYVYVLVVSICFGCFILNDYLSNLVDSTVVNVEFFGLLAVSQQLFFHLCVAFSICIAVNR